LSCGNLRHHKIVNYFANVWAIPVILNVQPNEIIYILLPAAELLVQDCSCCNYLFSPFIVTSAIGPKQTPVPDQLYCFGWNGLSLFFKKQARKIPLYYVVLLKKECLPWQFVRLICEFPNIIRVQQVV